MTHRSLFGLRMIGRNQLINGCSVVKIGTNIRRCYLLTQKVKLNKAMEPFEIKQSDGASTIYVTHNRTGKTVKFLPVETIPVGMQQVTESIVYDDLGGMYLAEMADGSVLDAELVELAWAYYNHDASKKNKTGEDTTD
ncbi:hypothetical protein SAMN05660226_02682 [Parapedobacter luteus]|uniref:Uncharacterized protein n=2 Tax=Sphingobacteriaceae TaxID=84566 RepID=A0A1T5DC57_9SPHI|nr:hypothetical protein SAMN05660226_02682 [Parapedobacter luteus]